MTKKKHRALEALRRLGAEPPAPDPNFYCHHERWRSYGDRCPAPPVRLRECWWDDVKRWYCVAHDPVRIEHEARNKRKRLEDKKARWRQMERERDGGRR